MADENEVIAPAKPADAPAAKLFNPAQFLANANANVNGGDNKPASPADEKPKDKPVEQPTPGDNKPAAEEKGGEENHEDNGGEENNGATEEQGEKPGDKKPSPSDEFDFNAYNKPNAADEKPADAPTGDSWADIAKDLGITAASKEELVAAIKSRDKKVIEEYRRDPSARIHKILEGDSTQKVSAYLQAQHGWSEEDANQYIETIISKRGAEALNDEAFIADKFFQNQLKQIDGNRAAMEAKSKADTAQLQSQMRSIIAGQTSVFTVPVDKEKNQAFSEWYFNGGLAQHLSSPEQLLEVGRFLFEKNNILKKVADTARDKGYEEAKKEYNGKLFGKDTKSKEAVSKGEQKRNPPAKGGFDAQKFIQNARDSVAGVKN